MAAALTIPSASAQMRDGPAISGYGKTFSTDGAQTSPGDIVAIVHGPATPSIVKNAAFGRKAEGKANPNLELITKLQAAGVTVAVCDQALHGQGFQQEEVATGVRIDVSALTTLATLQLRGWALIPD